MSDVFNDMFSGLGDIAETSKSLVAFVDAMPTFFKVGIGIAVVGFWVRIVIKLLVD